MNTVLKICFKDFNDMPFEIYEKWRKSNKNPIEFFSGKSFALLTNSEQSFFENWLGFFYKKPTKTDLNFSKINYLEFCFAQKIDAIQTIKKHQNDLIEALPILIAIFEQCPAEYNFKKNIEKTKEVSKKNVTFVLNYGSYLLHTILKFEQSINSKLKPIKISKEQINAGIENLQKDWSVYGMVDNFAKQNILNYEQVFKLSIATIHANLLYNNHLQAYNQNLQEQYKIKNGLNKKNI